MSDTSCALPRPKQRPLYPMDPREVWRRCYSRFRARKLEHLPLWEVITEETGARDVFDGPVGLEAMRIQQALEAMRKPPRDLRQVLAETVLNGFGSRNPWGEKGCSRFMGPPPPRPPAVYGRPGMNGDRYRIKARLKARGQLTQDGGGWVRGVSLPGWT